MSGVKSKEQSSLTANNLDFSSFHKPVLINEVVSFFEPRKGQCFIDCTFGSGGHSLALLESGAIVIGIDRDLRNQEVVLQFKKIYPNQFFFYHDKFSNITNIIKETQQSLNINQIDGILYDLGVSSMQLDEGERGFSFNKSGPLKMEMGINDISAYDVVNFFKEKDLADIIYFNSDEKFARKIAKAIVLYRKNKMIESTLELAEIVEKAINLYNFKIHPATKTFQAIRMFVNKELEEIKNSLENAIQFVNSGCKLAVISFHSTEDRVVKNIFNHYSDKKQESINRNDPFVFKKKDLDERSVKIKLMAKKAILPTDEEIFHNIRSRSAKLRICEIL